MPPKTLREPFDTLAAQLIETIRQAGGDSSGQIDLRYGVRAVLRKFEVTLRPIPLDTEDILEPPPVCPVCQKPTGTSVAELRLSDGKRVHAHPECVNWPPRPA
jgi:hypothetical protein